MEKAIIYSVDRIRNMCFFALCRINDNKPREHPLGLLAGYLFNYESTLQLLRMCEYLTGHLRSNQEGAVTYYRNLFLKNLLPSCKALNIITHRKQE